MRDTHIEKERRRRGTYDTYEARECNNNDNTQIYMCIYIHECTPLIKKREKNTFICKKRFEKEEEKVVVEESDMQMPDTSRRR